MQQISDPAPVSNNRALVIGKAEHKVNRLKNLLADFFRGIDLLTDLRQLNSLSADNPSVIVVTDTMEDVLRHDFLMTLRSLHPRAGLLCLADRISQETEKVMRCAGLLFLGSYDHFEDCYSNVMQTALRPQITKKHQSYQSSNPRLKTFGRISGRM